jgi:hypothetical protein
VIVEEMETTSGTKTSSFTLPYCLDFGPKFFSGKRDVLVDVLYSLETSSSQAAHPNWLRDWLACFSVGLHSVADGENDNAPPPTSEEFFQKDDRVLKYCLFISKLRTMHRELYRAGTVETSSR